MQKSKSQEEIIANFKDVEIECELPNASIYTFQGNLRFGIKNTSVSEQQNLLEVPLETDNLCLRGSSLRNTEWVIGVAIFTGHDTKVMMNSAKSIPKFSKIEVITQKYIVWSIIIQAVLCLISAIATSIFNKSSVKGGVDCSEIEGVITDTNMGSRYVKIGENDYKNTPCYLPGEREAINAYWYLALN